MFEEQTQAGAPPKNLPSEPMDMFEETEKPAAPGSVASPDDQPKIKTMPDALSAGLLKKKEEEFARPASPAGLGEMARADAGQGQPYKMKAPILGRIFFWILLIVLIGGVSFGAWSLFGNKSKIAPAAPQPAAAPPVSEQKTEPEVPFVPMEEASNTVPAMNNDNILFGEPVDTDKDGLDDIREKELGTDPNNPDTDGDGLSDGDEVIIWKTNPLNPDMDGDGYSDGMEVRNGYNPLGPGKLFNIRQSTSTI